MTRSPRPRRRPPTTTTTSPTKISTASPTTAVTTPSPAPVPTTVVVSMTGATKQDYDDVAEVTTNIVIENTDLTSLAAGGLGSNKCNAVLSTMDASFQKLDTVSRNMDIFGNDLLVVLVSAFPIPSRRAVGDRVREHLQHPGAALLARLGVPGPRHDKTDSAPSTAMPRWPRWYGRGIQQPW